MNSLYYLALLEQKPRALEQAAPLQEWAAHAFFERLRRLLEARMDKRGRKEYMQILQLLETFSIGQVDYSMGQAHHLCVLSFDAIKHLVMPVTISVFSGRLHGCGKPASEAAYERLHRAVNRNHRGCTASYVPFTAIGAELLCEIFSRRYEHGATLMTSNLPFDEWISVLGSEQLTCVLLEIPTYHVHILEMNGASYRLATSTKRQQRHAKSNISFEKRGTNP